MCIENQKVLVRTGNTKTITRIAWGPNSDITDFLATQKLDFLKMVTIESPAQVS